MRPRIIHIEHDAFRHFSRNRPCISLHDGVVRTKDVSWRIVVEIDGCNSGCQSHRIPIANLCTWVNINTHIQRWDDIYHPGDLVGATSIARRNRERNLVTTWLSVGMSGIRSRSSLPVTEIPSIAGDLIYSTQSCGIGGRGAGELRGLALADGGSCEVGHWVGIDLHLS